MIGERQMWEHTVSSGTLRTEDLISSLSAELARFYDHTPELVRESRAWTASPLDWASLDYCEVDWEEVSDDDLESVIGEPYHARGPELVQDLFNELNELAPEGWFFGAHPGDGADFGWWRDGDYAGEDE